MTFLIYQIEHCISPKPCEHNSIFERCGYFSQRFHKTPTFPLTVTIVEFDDAARCSHNCCKSFLSNKPRLTFILTKSLLANWVTISDTKLSVKPYLPILIVGFKSLERADFLMSLGMLFIQLPRLNFGPFP